MSRIKKTLWAVVWMAGILLTALNSIAVADPPPTSRNTPYQMGHGGLVTDLAFGPDNRRLASSTPDPALRDDSPIKIWDIINGKLLQSIDFRIGKTGRVLALAYSPDGSLLASGSDSDPILSGPQWPEHSSIKLWALADEREWAVFQGHKHGVCALAFSPDGRTLASGSHDRTIKLWDVYRKQERATLSTHNGSVRSVAFSPDGKMLASGSNDDTIKLWDVATGKEQATLKGHKNPVTTVAFSPDGKSLVSCSNDYTIRLWDVATGKEKVVLNHKSVSSVAFSPDGKRLASASTDKTIRLWDAATGKEQAILKGNTDLVQAVVFSPDGKTLASAGADPAIKLWSISPE